ncbi:sodium-coupled neutral amino acid transporter 7-like [Watersipora subatra]|uniref:sodium-coupled neutral amino acid transporter 7-like n=1 Tax=Watersipora subatra TaxID=2589382 RepID=UPI00355B6CFC
MDETAPLLGPNSINDVTSENLSLDERRENSAGTTTWYASIFIVINAALGAGLLEFPYAFSISGGVMVSLIVQGILIAFIVGSLFLLAYCSEFNQSTTFPSTMRSICGKPTEVASAICIIIYTYGTCITFLIVISDQLSQFFRFVTSEDDFCNRWYMNKKFTLTVTSFLFILPLCFSKKIDFLKYASYAGVVAVLYVIIMIIVRFADPLHKRAEIVISYGPTSFLEIFTVIPTVCFSYQCHVSIIPIYSCMKGRNTKNFAKTVLIAISVCLFAYSVSATLGYYTFGNTVNTDILLSYDPPSVDVVIAVLMIAAKTYTTYPILLFCGRVEIEKLWMYVWRLTDEMAAVHEFKRRCVIAVTWFLSTLLIAIYVPTIAIVIDVLGGLAALFIFFFPGMCLMKIALDYVPSSKLFKKRFFITAAVCFMFLGAFLFGLVTTQSIMDDISKPPQNTSTC